jgi:MATE family multidrug resistance protein
LRDWRAYHSLLRSNRHLFVRTICLLFSFAFFTAMGDNFGTAVLAANTIMLQFILLFAYGLDGFAYAAEALTGNRLGAGDWAGFDAAVKACAHWCGWSALLTSALFMLLGAPLFNLLTGLPEVLDLLQRHHWWLVALPLLAAPSYLLDGIFIGTATTRPMMYTMLASTGLVFLPCWYLTTAWGNHGLWLSFSVFNASRGMLLYACFLGLGRMHDRFTVGARQEET